jgi:hypothetical protein
MVKKKKDALGVESAGDRRYICVPVEFAQDLHLYLRSNKVQAAPPEPSFTGFDSIELPKKVDVDGVQSLLNAWN